jgi:hypothetical protein
MGMAYDAADGYVLMYGGWGCTGFGGGGEPCNTTWKFQSGAWTNLTASVPGDPPHLAFTTMAYDSTDGYAVLFGGTGGDYNHEQMVNDTWSYRAGVWQRMNTTQAPGPRDFSTMVDDPGTHSLFLTGGRNDTVLYLTDAWSYSAGRWTLLNRSDTFANTPPVQVIEGPGGSVLAVGCGRWAVYAKSCPYLFQHSAGGWTNVSRNGSFAGPWPWARVSPNPQADQALGSGGVDYRDTPYLSTWVLTTPLTVSISAMPTPLTFRSPLNLSVNVSGGGPFPTGSAIPGFLPAARAPTRVASPAYRRAGAPSPCESW